MTGKKTKNRFREKRIGQPFSGIQRHAKKLKETSIGSKINDATPGTSRDSSSELAQPISASRMKLALPDSLSQSSDEQRDSGFQGQGYRLIHLNQFSSTLSIAHVCEGENNKLTYFVKFTCGQWFCAKCFNCLIQFLCSCLL